MKHQATNIIREQLVPETPETPKTRESNLGVFNFLSRFRTLALLVTLWTAGSCTGEADVDTGSDPILLSHQEGAMKFNVYRTGQAEVTDAYGKNLYSFIRGTLEAKGIFKGMDEQEKLDVINAVIHFCRDLNPEDIDKFETIVGHKLYFPETLYVLEVGKAKLVDIGFESAHDKDKELEERLKSTQESPSFTVLTQKLHDAIGDMTKKSAESDTVQAEKDLAKFDLLMKAAGIERYHNIFVNYSKPVSKGEAKKYEGETAAQLQEKIEPLKAKLVKNSTEKEELETLVRVRNAKMYEELLLIVSHLTPDQIEKHQIFRYTVFDAPSKHGFYDLKGIWKWKKEHKSKGKEAFLYDDVLEELDGKDNSVNMERWLTTQEQAVAYFQKHASELGYQGEYVKYVNPALILSVIHAEFLSEFSGKAFCDLVPYAMESTNLPYGPAVNDKEFSAGVVQMIRDTFRTLLNDNYEVTKRGSNGETVEYITNVDRLRILQKSDPSFKIVVPTYTVSKGGRIYDPKTYVQAMTTDFNSNLFFATVAVANHIENAFEKLMADKNFRTAWGNAPEADHYLFLASLAPLAINGGKGGATDTAVRLLNAVDSKSLEDYITGLPNAARGSTRRRGAEVGLRTMTELLDRAKSTPARSAAAPKPEAKKETLNVNPRVAIFTTYQPLLDQAAKDGFKFSNDVQANHKIYAASKKSGVKVPMKGEGYQVKEGKNLEAVMYPDALKTLENFAREFKKRSGGFGLVVTDLLRSPEQQDAISISKGTHPGGRTVDIADGWFLDRDGNMFSWADFSGSKPTRGPKADLIEKVLRPIMIRLIEEYQARGLMMAFDETEKGAIARGNTRSGGHWHVYIPLKTEGKPVGPLLED